MLPLICSRRFFPRRRPERRTERCARPPGSKRPNTRIRNPASGEDFPRGKCEGHILKGSQRHAYAFIIKVTFLARPFFESSLGRTLYEIPLNVGLMELDIQQR